MALMRRRDGWALVLGLLWGAGFGAAVHAQSAWPKVRHVQLVVPYSAGGSLDATARLLAQKLSDRWGHSVTVENVTGAGGAIGMQKVIQAAPDGHTFLIAGDAPFQPGQEKSDNPYKYDVRKDLVPVVMVNTAPMIVVAHPSVQANNLAELLKLAHQAPGRLNYATSGIGTIPHLAMEAIKAEAGAHIVHIPYRGAAQIVSDVAGNQIELSMLISSSAMTQIQARTIKALAVTGDKRLASLPQVPTVAETPGLKGLKDFRVESWSGIYAPAKTPDAIVQQMNAEVNEVLRSEAVRAKLAEASVLAKGGTPAEFTAYIDRDRAQTRAMLRHVNLNP